jgi:hypothetical protein
MSMNISRETQENYHFDGCGEMTAHCTRTFMEGINTEINTLPMPQKLG